MAEWLKCQLQHSICQNAAAGSYKLNSRHAFYLIFDYLTILLFVFEIGLFCALTDYLRIQIVSFETIWTRNSKKYYLLYLYLRNSRNNCFETRKPARDVSLQYITITKFGVIAIDLLLITIQCKGFASVS